MKRNWTNLSFTWTEQRLCRRANAIGLCEHWSVKWIRSARLVRVSAVWLLGHALALSAQTNGAITNAVPAAVSTNAPAVTAPASVPASASKKLDYSAFKIITERNVFNGNRSGQRLVATRMSTTRSARVESLSLVGTLLSEKAPVAFFDGTAVEFRKAIKAGTYIAGFKLLEILPAGVRLEAGTNTMELRVGAALRREDGGDEWRVSTVSSASGAAYASSLGGSSDRSHSSHSDRSSDGNGSSESSRPGSSSGASVPSVDVNEVLKRLMKKREKE